MSEKVQENVGAAKSGAMKNPQIMTDKELVAKVKELSDTIYVSRDHFIACLIEVKKRKLWDNGKFHSIFHYAKVKACLTEDVVERVFRMYARIQDFPDILKLFLEVKVSWSKIDIVARVLNKRNVRHFARRLLTDSTSTLKRLVKNIRQRNEQKKGAVVGGVNQRRANGGKEQGGKPEPADATSSKQGSFTFTQSKGSGGQPSFWDSDEAAVGSEDGPGEAGGHTTGEAGGHTTGEANGHKTCDAGENKSCEACGHVKGDFTKRGRGRQLVPMMVTPSVRDMYERLLSKWQRKDKKVRMNEVAKRVMLAALEMGIDLTFDSDRGPAASQSKASASGAQNKIKKAKPASRARAWWKRPYVQIVNYDVATGAFLTKTYDGWERVCDKDLAYREALCAPVDLKQLRLEAKKFAAEYIRKHILEGRDIMDYIPEFIKYYIELRSQGFCEFPGCKNRACTIHHLKRFGRDPDCDPDGLGNFCQECEKLFHDGAVRNEFGPFKDFKIREDYVPQTKDEKERAKIDAKVQQWRKKSKEGPTPYPLPRRGRRKMRFGKG